MRIVSLEQAIGEVGTQVRTHFTNLMERREEITRIFEEDKQQLNAFIAAIWNDLPDGLMFVEHKDIFYMVRKRRSDFIWISDYLLSHLRNSLIANVLLDQDLEPKKRMDIVIYIYYYYWFLVKREAVSIDNITHNVCFELQEIIKLLIQKELTLYREYNTVELVDMVRWRLASENLLLMAKIQTVNLRRL